jgi:hypothetical protein
MAKSERNIQITPFFSFNRNNKPFFFVTSIHKDLRERLPDYAPALYRQVCLVLEENKAERHIRGGLATRRKYKGE